MRGHGGNVKKTGKRAAALLLSWVMALGGGSMPVMAEMVPGRETVREETEAGQAESPESGQTGPQGQETVQPGAAPEESTGRAADRCAVSPSYGGVHGNGDL